MPYLGDFIGHVVSELSISRAQADLEALRLAERYATDPLLKHFPVPRFRLPNVTFRIPVAVSEMQEPRSEAQPRGYVQANQIAPAFSSALNAQLVASKRTLGREETQRINDAVEAEIQRIGHSEPILTGHAIADLLVDAVAEVLPVDERAGSDTGDLAFRVGLRERLATALVMAREPPPRLSVQVTAPELRESTNVVQIELSVTEEAVEWTVLDELGEPTDRLVPE